MPRNQRQGLVRTSSDLKPRDLYKKLLKVFEAHYGSLIAAKADPMVIGAYQQFMGYYRSLGVTQIETIFTQAIGRGEPSVQSTERPPRGHVSGNYSEIAIEVVSRLIDDPRVSRKILEEIAASRFGLTRGELSNLSNVEQLRQRLLSLIENEQTHQAIGRLAYDSKKTGSKW